MALPIALLRTDRCGDRVDCHNILTFTRNFPSPSLDITDMFTLRLTANKIFLFHRHLNARVKSLAEPKELSTGTELPHTLVYGVPQLTYYSSSIRDISEVRTLSSSSTNSAPLGTHPTPPPSPTWDHYPNLMLYEDHVVNAVLIVQ